MNNKDLALYLRCSNVSSENRPRKCDQTCPYFVMEEVRDELPCPPDIEIDGKGYWTGCDYEQIAEDAAKHIEELETRNNQCETNTTDGFLCTFDEDNKLHELKEECSVTIYCDSEEEAEKLSKKLQNMHKYRWHDLRKNPEDLPKEGKLVETIYHQKNHPDVPMNYMHEHEYGGQGFNKHTAKIVIVWRYVEPFKEEEE